MSVNDVFSMRRRNMEFWVSREQTQWHMATMGFVSIRSALVSSSEFHPPTYISMHNRLTSEKHALAGKLDQNGVRL